MSVENEDDGRIAERTREEKLEALAQKESVSPRTRELARRALARRQEESSS